jgi:hypothetical protein
MKMYIRQKRKVWINVLILKYYSENTCTQIAIFVICVLLL